MRFVRDLKRGKWLVAIFLPIFFYPYPLWGGQAESEDYVFVLKVDGGTLFRIVEKVNGKEKELVKEEVKRMEVLYPNTVLFIDEGVSVSLACAGCSPVNLSHKDNPYTVKMADFT